MGLDKYLALLSTAQLWFAKSSAFTDRYETQCSPYLLEYLRREGRDDEFVRRFNEEYTDWRDRTHVNCWSIGTNDSYAMWKIYLSDPTAGVAIRSTAAKVRKSILPTEGRQIFDGKVIYSSHIRDELTYPRLVTTKTPHYSYEQEWRLFFINREPLGLLSQFSVGSRVNVDLSILIEQVCISPFSPDWLQDLVQEITQKYLPSQHLECFRSIIKEV
jgi:hypothetical protein